jgi:hypothetical protein
MRVRPNGDIEIDVPTKLDWSLLFYFLCCCRKKKFRAYRMISELGSQNLVADMDLIRFVRRQRMHGFGIHFGLNKPLRALSARLAFSRPIREDPDEELFLKDTTNLNEIDDKWYFIENLQKSD